MYKIVFVCTGNTCRSPMAEGILSKVLQDAGYDDVHVSSAGIGTLDGYPATPYAVEIAKRHNVDISQHHSTRMNEFLFKQADLILAMAKNHYEHLDDFPDASQKLYRLKAFPQTNSADARHSVEDPLGGTLEEYKVTYQEIEQEIKRALPEIIRRINHRKS